jgi:hypothetical protein
MAKHHNIIKAAWVVTGLMLVAIPAAQASKVTQLYTTDGSGRTDPRNCSFYLTDDQGWVGVDMSQPNAAKLASDLTFWATLGARIGIAVYNGACGAGTVGAADISLPLVAQ